MVSEQPAANRITVNAAEQDDCIEAVSVFQSDRAEIKRRVNLDLKKGQNHVHIERLPSCLNGDSIRVDGTGTAVIFDVVYHAPSYSASSSSDESVTTAQHALEALQKERDIAREQSQFLGSYGKTLDSKNVNIEDVQRFLDMFGPRQIAVAKRIQELDVQIKQASQELDEARSKVYEDKRGEKRGTRVTVTVLAETDGKAELMLTYVVSNASWTPLYDIRAAIAKSPDATSKMILHYRASITQTTGENWPEVALTLSTASPQLGSKVPTLSPWKIGFPAPPPPPGQAQPAARMYKSESRFVEQYEREESDDDMGFGLFDDELAPAMAARTAHVATAGVLSATFGIPGRSDIPSDGGSHKVVVAVLDLEAELEWICVPREKESVFLTCKVVNSSEFTLLPGEASVFMDDNFVSKSRIEHVSPNDSFKTSLGVDSSLRVTYPPAKTLNRTMTQSSFSFLARERQSVSAQSQRITIRNSRLTTVSDLRVVDHLPVSTDAKLKVNVIAPGGLDVHQAPSSPTRPESEVKKNDKERPWTDARKGVKARWAPLDVGGEGTVEWKCEIGPSEETELELAWEVLAPAGQQWQKV
ncbi:Protein F37C4,5 [Caenorhabditis elegans] [Rhizoctonia solani]|uniref:Protein F37C4,5 [Caenorhabditis elegans] n=1 Tax=Rhizoctonia solani TaxID=456999 RepID=A0A0K6GF95_9AGAM|nr:Protein F37C4,5 [Caenorhabditis elegans] [Rhizoctonia solani]